MADEDPRLLNPGSLAAIECGCTCPLSENNYGFKAPLPDESWWIDVDCPLHGNSRTIDVQPPIEIIG